MQLNKLHTTLLLTLCMLLTACNDQDVLVDNPNSSKTPIELSVGGVDGIVQSATTRASASAIITDGTSKTMETFKTNATIFRVMMSEYDTGHVDFDDPDDSHVKKFTVSRGDVTANSLDVVFDEKNIKYWDDAHARSSMLSIWGFAQQGIPQGTGWLSGSFDIPNPYWNGTDPLTEYKQQTYSTATTRYDWVKNAGSKGAIYPCINVWKTSHNTDASIQDGTSVLYQDLLFTNNIADNTAYSKRDGRLKFDFTSRQFPKANDTWDDGTKKTELKFYHAMSKITIKIKKGEGFTNSDPFAFTSGTNVKISGMNTEGTFNIKEGEFQKINASNPITKIYQWTTPSTGDAYTLEALAIPNIHEFMLTHDGTDNNSRFVSGKKELTTDVMMEFTIDNNKYQVTSGQLYDALHVDGDPSKALVINATEKTNNGTYIPLEAGKNYVFTFTIGKTKIKDITAQVAQWENVEAEPFNPSNARIKLQLEERGTPVTAPVDIYRAADNPSAVSDTWESYKWTTGYVDNKNVFKEINSAWKLENDWFWDNNKTYYHFRAVMPTGQTLQTNATPDPDEDYVSLSSAVSYTDVLWGAPMRDVANNETADNFKFIYSKETGFDVKNSAVDASKSQIYQAIGPTEDKLKLTLFHMMSDLTIKIKTTTGADKVTLVDETDPQNKVYTKVQLEGHYANGTVLLGTGLIKTTGSTTAKDRTAPAIEWNSVDGDYQVYKYGIVPQGLTGVQLRITTPDKNEYIVDLSNVIASTVTNVNISNPYRETGSGTGKYTIDRWYPGFKYNYTFTLKKTGITDIQATIVNWETVTAEDETVQIQ